MSSLVSSRSLGGVFWFLVPALSWCLSCNDTCVHLYPEMNKRITSWVWQKGDIEIGPVLDDCRTRDFWFGFSCKEWGFLVRLKLSDLSVHTKSSCCNFRALRVGSICVSALCSLAIHNHQHPNFILHETSYQTTLMMHSIHLESPLQGRHLENGTAPNYYSQYLIPLCFHLKMDKTLCTIGEHHEQQRWSRKLYDVSSSRDLTEAKEAKLCRLCHNSNVTQWSKSVKLRYSYTRASTWLQMGKRMTRHSPAGSRLTPIRKQVHWS